MGSEVGNGKDHFCPLGGKWKAEELISAVEKVNETHSLLSTLVQHTAHLPSIAKSNDEIRTYLISAATGKNHVPLDVMIRVVKMGGWIIVGLTFIIVFLLTGEHAGFISALHQ